MSNALIEQMNLAAKVEDWPRVESVARHWLSQQKFFVPHLFLIHALLAQKNTDEADQEFDELASYKFNLADRLDGFPVVKARYQNKLDNHYVISTMRPHVSFEGGGMTSDTRRWDIPFKAADRDAFLLAAKKIIDESSAAPAPLARTNAAICTFGSCFAANLARLMSEQGMNATNLLIEESINSTYANRVLMEVVCNHLGTQAHTDMAAEFGDAFFDKIRLKLANATHIVLTVGVAPCFFSVRDGSFVFAKNYRDLLKSGEIVMRTTTCAENVANISRILDLMASIAPNATRVVTVSPVPLAGTTEMSSVVVADCVSKSTLRAAVHEVLSEVPSAHYFPAFEIVRWMSAYTSMDVFGADDRNSRHVSNWVVENIVSGFIDEFFV